MGQYIRNLSGEFVQGTAPGQLLQWNDVTRQWDLVGSGAAEGDLLVWDSATSSWVPSGTSGLQPQLAKVFTDQPAVRVVVIGATGNWAAFPNGAGFYTGTALGDFAIDTASGVITYTGPQRWFNVIGQATVSKQVGATPEFLELTATVNGGLIGLGTDVDDSGAAVAELNVETSISFATAKQLNTNDTLQCVMRNEGSVDDINLVLYNLVVTPVGA